MNRVVDRTVDSRPASTPVCPTGVCIALERSRCVCDGEWRMTLAPRGSETLRRTEMEEVTYDRPTICRVRLQEGNDIELNVDKVQETADGMVRIHIFWLGDKQIAKFRTVVEWWVDD